MTKCCDISRKHGTPGAMSGLPFTSCIQINIPLISTYYSSSYYSRFCTSASSIVVRYSIGQLPEEPPMPGFEPRAQRASRISRQIRYQLTYHGNVDHLKCP